MMACRMLFRGHLVSILILLLAPAFISPAVGTNAPYRYFGKAIMKVADEIIGTHTFKAHLVEQTNFVTKRFDAEELVTKLSTDIEKKISDRENSITRLKDAVKRSFYRNAWAEYPQCCELADFDHKFKYDDQFLGKVDTESLCLMKSSHASKSDRIPNEDFLRTARENLLRYPSGIKSQYFGSENGTLLRFPAAIAENCGTYDNRYRPWYVQASAPVPKDIVLVLDMSGSMAKFGRLQATIHAATTVLETLSPNDRVAVVAFSDVAYAVGSDIASSAISDKTYAGFKERKSTAKICSDTTMLSATPRNIKHLTEAVKGMVPHGDTNYMPGLNMAFDLLYKVFKQDVSSACRNTKNRISSTEIAASRHRAIMFLSDGKPSDAPQKILDLIYNRNRAMHNSVVILCYALGEGTFGRFVEKMSKQQHLPSRVTTCNHQLEQCDVDGSFACGLPRPKEGLYRQVTDSRYLRSEMGSYYTFFAARIKDVGQSFDIFHGEEVVWSVPYFDAGGMGMVLTSATPVLVEGDLVGVIGTDLTAREMMADVTYFHTGGKSGYAFLMDEFGRVLLHPYMPSPATVGEDPVLADIGALERTPVVRDFLNNILQRPTGSDRGSDLVYELTARTKYITPRDHRNVETRDATMTYRCTRVRHLVVCVVVEAETHFEVNMKRQRVGNDYSFIYHRFDIKLPTNTCSYKDAVSSGIASSVFFGPSAFVDAGSHLGRPETTESIKLLEDFMSNDAILTTREDVNLRKGIRDSVRITAKFDQIWNNMTSKTLSIDGFPVTPHQIRRNILYRYFSTEDGVFRIQPGIRMPKSYNPIHRPWYIQAQALLSDELKDMPCVDGAQDCGDVAAISPPYVDATGAGVVVTISQAVLTPVRSGRGVATWHLAGVAAGDMKLSFLKILLEDSIKECKSREYKCVLMDLSGYVVYDSFLAATDEAMIENIVSSNYHLTSAHRMLADVLYAKGVLVRHKCADVSKVAYLEEFRVDLKRLEASRGSLPFRAERVDHTNIILLIIPSDLWIPQYVGQRECIKHHEASIACRRPVQSAQCESPCVNLKEAEAKYDACLNKFNFTWASEPPPCVPDKFIDERFGFIVEEDGSSNLREIDIASLRPCFSATFQLVTSAAPPGVAIAILLVTVTARCARFVRQKINRFHTCAAYVFDAVVVINVVLLLFQIAQIGST